MSVELKEFPVDQIQLHSDRFTTPFWDAASERRLIVPKCSDCGTYRFPPTARCPKCHGESMDWQEVSGNGTIYSFTIIEGGVPQHLKSAVPYAVVVVLLDEVPVRIVAGFTGGSSTDLTIGAPVSVAWAEGDEGVVVPRFRRRV